MGRVKSCVLWSVVFLLLTLSGAEASGIPKIPFKTYPIARWIQFQRRLPNMEELAQIVRWSPAKMRGFFRSGNGPGNLNELIGILEQEHPVVFERIRNSIAKSYGKLASRLGRTPTMPEIAEELQISASDIKGWIGSERFFTSIENLKTYARQLSPRAFRNVVDTDTFTERRFKAFQQALKKRKRMIVTTAVPDAPVNQEFFQALRSYAEKNDAEIIILPANMQTEGLDPVLLNTEGVHVLIRPFEVSPKLTLQGVRVTPHQVRPLTGLERIGMRGQTQVIGSPKMHVKTTATPHDLNDQTPHQLLSTGAVTEPAYGKQFVPKKNEQVATRDHAYGALILEKVPAGKGAEASYLYRHVEFIPEKKGFMDLGVLYTHETAGRVQPEALVLGDIHVGDTDPKILQSVFDQIRTLKPKRVVLHDLFNGKSVNHHEELKFVTLAQRAHKGELDLEGELNRVNRFLNQLLSLDPNLELVVVPSNHDYWLNRWLEAGEFMKQPHNARVGAELATAYINGRDPLVHSILQRGLDDPSRVTFLERGKTMKLGPPNRSVEIGLHGDHGANGRKSASLLDFQKGTDRAVFGHTHTSERLNGVVNVGTLTKLLLPYNQEGFTSWVQSLAIIGPNGEIQVLQFKNGRWSAISAIKRKGNKT